MPMREFVLGEISLEELLREKLKILSGSYCFVVQSLYCKSWTRLGQAS